MHIELQQKSRQKYTTHLHTVRSMIRIIPEPSNAV